MCGRVHGRFTKNKGNSHSPAPALPPARSLPRPHREGRRAWQRRGSRGRTRVVRWPRVHVFTERVALNKARSRANYCSRVRREDHRRALNIIGPWRRPPTQAAAAAAAAAACVRVSRCAGRLERSGASFAKMAHTFRSRDYLMVAPALMYVTFFSLYMFL